MSRKPLTMRKIKDILRLKFENQLNDQQVASICHAGRTTVQDYVKRAQEAQISWEEARGLSDEELEKWLFPGNSISRYCGKNTEKEKTEGYSYSHFCDLFQQYARSLDCTMRQFHKAGEKLLSTTVGRRSGSSTVKRVKFVKPNFSSRCWAPAATHYAEAYDAPRMRDMGSEILR